MSNNYVETIYNLKERPITLYPYQLVDYFICRYHIKKGSKILDSGSGRGDFSFAFAKRGMCAWAIDKYDYKRQFEKGVNFVRGGIWKQIYYHLMIIILMLFFLNLC